MRWTVDLNQRGSSGVRGSPPRQSACRYPSRFFKTGERNISFTAVHNLFAAPDSVQLSEVEMIF